MMSCSVWRESQAAVNAPRNNFATGLAADGFQHLCVVERRAKREAVQAIAPRSDRAASHRCERASHLSSDGSKRKLIEGQQRMSAPPCFSRCKAFMHRLRPTLGHDPEKPRAARL
jgi:hypothetical protein